METGWRLEGGWSTVAGNSPTTPRRPWEAGPSSCPAQGRVPCIPPLPASPSLATILVCLTAWGWRGCGSLASAGAPRGRPPWGTAWGPSPQRVRAAGRSPSAAARTPPCERTCRRRALGGWQRRTRAEAAPAPPRRAGTCSGSGPGSAVRLAPAAATGPR
eukprot:402783-Prorocentrum_minimum.AAC.4